MHKTTFALYFGNRGFFPGELIASTRQEMVEACEKNGYGYLIMDVVHKQEYNHIE